MNDLISVVVVTYNSEKTILDTLQSVYNQTFPNIELIISDDSSTDKTVIMCKQWIEERQKRFYNVKIVTSTLNTGVVVNLNRGINECRGNWFKILAGDDILPNDSLELNYNFIQKNNIKTMCCSRTASFYEDKNKKKHFVALKPDYYTEYILKKSVKSQYKKQLYEYIVIPLITSFINVDFFKKVGMFDENFPEIEDYPFCLKVSKMGYEFNYNPDIISYYHRTGIDSVSQSKTGFMNVSAFDLNGKLHRQDKMFVLPNIARYHIIFYMHFYVDLFRRYFTIHILGNKKNFLSNCFNKIMMVLDPYALKRKIFNVILEIKYRSDKKEIINKLNEEGNKNE